jgi:hypothetical protein
MEMSQWQHRGEDQSIFAHNATTPTVGDGTETLDLGLLVLRLKSYLTERIELAYGFDTDQGPLASAEGLRQLVSLSRHHACTPVLPHADYTPSRVVPYHYLLLSSSFGKPESLYARLGSHAAQWTDRGVVPVFTMHQAFGSGDCKSITAAACFGTL